MIDRLLRFLLLGSLFLLPLLTAYRSIGYEETKVLFFISSISLAGFIWLLRKPELKWDLIKIVSLVFILTLLIASVFGINLNNSLLGREPYFQGWVLYSYLFLFALLVSQAKIKLKLWAAVLAGSSMLVGLVALKDWMLINIFGQQIPTYAGRVVSTFGQPNFYAGLLLLSLPFSYYLIRDKNRRLSYFGGISGLVSMAGIFASYSRSAILIALILLISGLIAQLKGKFKLGLIVFGVIGVSVLISLKLSSGIVGDEASKPIETINPDLTRESVEKRIYIWPVAFNIISERLLTGYGLENIGAAFPSYFEKNKHLIFEENLKISPVLISLKELNIDRSHNYLLDLWLFGGVGAVLAWILLVCVLLRQLIKKPGSRIKKILLVSLLTYIAWIQLQNQSIVQLIYFWFIVGLIGNEKGIGY